MITLFSPKFCKTACNWITRWLTPAVWLLLPITVAIIILSPADITQGEVVRILYLHVPMAFASLALFLVVTVMSSLSWVFHLKIARHLASISAEVGLACALATLISGSTWGAFTWGDWWVWDARLTTYLMLALIYSAFIVMDRSVREYKASEKTLVVLAWVGMIDIVLVHFSVTWWQSLHQQSTLLNLSQNTMPWSMLGPLVLSMLLLGFCIIVYMARKLSQQMGWV